jgi:hypothetical protein
MMIKCNNLEEKTILKANHNTIKIRATYQINDFKVNSCLITDWVKILQHIIKCVLVLSFVVSGSMFYELEKRAQQWAIIDRERETAAKRKSPFSSFFLQDDVYPLLWNLVSQSNTLSWHVNICSRWLIFFLKAKVQPKQTGFTLPITIIVVDVNSFTHYSTTKCRKIFWIRLENINLFSRTSKHSGSAKRQLYSSQLTCRLRKRVQ